MAGGGEGTGSRAWAGPRGWGGAFGSLWHLAKACFHILLLSGHCSRENSYDERLTLGLERLSMNFYDCVRFAFLIAKFIQSDRKTFVFLVVFFFVFIISQLIAN